MPIKSNLQHMKAKFYAQATLRNLMADREDDNF
jgi:hypothetical protein